MIGTDVVEEQEIRDAFRGYIEDPLFRPDMHALVDLRSAELKTDTDIVHNFVKLLDDNQKRRGKNYRIALVVRDGIQETLSHLFSIYLQNRPVQCQVFKQRSPALDWLLSEDA